MKLTSTTSQPQSGIDQLAGRAQGLRTPGAGDARGFAQLLRAFEHEPESLVTQRTRSSGEKPEDRTKGLKDEPTGAEPDETSDAEDASETTDASTTGQPEPEQSGSNGDQGDHAQPIFEGAVGAEPTSQPTRDPSAASTPAAQNPPGPGEADRDVTPSQQREASLRLLSNQSEQAKLSIKGLVRSLTQSSGTDATRIAVDTRLGNAEASDGSPIDKQVGADPALKQTQSHPSSQNPAPDQSAPARPDASQPHRVPPASQLPVPGQPAMVPVSADPDQARADVQEARSTRVDAGVATQATRSTPALDATRLARLESAGQVARLSRAGSAQSVRAVTSSESAQFGASLKDAATTQGSLVEKMGAPETRGADRAAVLAQVQRGLASLLRSSGGDMTLKLTPASLGEVRIRIKSEGSRLSVRFEASTDEASDLLNASAKDLSAHLRTKGVHVDHLSIDRRDANQDAQQPNPNHADSQGDPHPGHDHRPGAQAHNGPRGPRHASIDEPARLGDTDAQQPAAIWTELGLDAIA